MNMLLKLTCTLALLLFFSNANAGCVLRYIVITDRDEPPETVPVWVCTPDTFGGGGFGGSPGGGGGGGEGPPSPPIDPEVEPAMGCNDIEAALEERDCGEEIVDMSPNGCTGDPNGSATPGGRQYSFLGACNAHDVCYGFVGSSQSACDQAFLDNMFDVCDDEFGSAEVVLGVPNIARASCRLRAQAYGTGVTLVGQSYYEDAQNDAECNQLNVASEVNGCNG